MISDGDTSRAGAEFNYDEPQADGGQDGALAPSGCSADVHFAIIPDWIFELPLTAQAFRLYAIAALHADRKGVAWPGRKRLAKMLGCTVRTVSRLFAELHASGAVTISSRFRPDGNGQTTNLLLVRRLRPPAEDHPPVTIVARGEGGDTGDTPSPGHPCHPLEVDSEEKKTPVPSAQGAAQRRGGPQAELVHWFQGAWSHYRDDAEYVPGRKDYVAAAALLKRATTEQVQVAACSMLESDDKFYRRAADLPLLLSQWNKIVLLVPYQGNGSL